MNNLYTYFAKLKKVNLGINIFNSSFSFLKKKESREELHLEI